MLFSLLQDFSKVIDSIVVLEIPKSIDLNLKMVQVRLGAILKPLFQHPATFLKDLVKSLHKILQILHAGSLYDEVFVVRT